MTPPPYHLRLNKAVDRFLLIDLLRCFTKAELLRYKYVGLGGPFLEDFKLLDQFFPSLRKISFELDEQTYKRQRFNQPTRLVRLAYGDMIERLEVREDQDSPLIVWFDSTQATEDVFDGFVRLLDIVPNGSVVRVTMRLGRKNVNPNKKLIMLLTNALQTRMGRLKLSPQDLEELNQDLANIVKEKVIQTTAQQGDLDSISRYLPSDADKMVEKPNGIVKVLFRAIHRAAVETFPPNCGRVFRLANASYYSDGTKMLSVTGIVLSEAEEDAFMKRFKGTAFFTAKWNQDPMQIDMPILTPKERMHLGKIMPVIKSPGKRLSKRLGFSIDPDRKTAEAEMEMYNQFYRYYPMFARVAL